MRTGVTLSELASRFGLELRGDGDTVINGVATLASAMKGQLSFLANRRYAAQLTTTNASAVILAADNADICPVACLVAGDPYSAFAKAAAQFTPRDDVAPGIHPSAVVDASADIAVDASVGPFCVIEAGASVGAGARIGPHCQIGAGSIIGARSRLVARVTLLSNVILGQRVLIHPGAVLGADGFGLAKDGDQWIKVPQLGGVRIGDDCEIGANTTIDRGALDDTVLENDVRLDNQIQIAHNVTIGAHTAMAGCVAVAGSTRIGRHCLIGGGAGILGHLQIADRVTVTARALVTHSIRESGEFSSGTPLQTSREWRRNAVRFMQLDELARRLGRLEKERNK
ncbi:MAG: UDP-3-O-(3-hydroxymyristoyl)glucosamine N-acyltransferase [Dokdonella sp.]